jgi:hypothetical protein
MDGDRKNNRLENLCWHTVSENQRNRHSNFGVPVEFVDEIPADSKELKFYGKYELEDGYWMDREKHLYFKNYLGKFYKLVIRINNGSKHYKVALKSGIRTHAYLSKL